MRNAHNKMGRSDTWDFWHGDMAQVMLVWMSVAQLYIRIAHNTMDTRGTPK